MQKSVLSSITALLICSTVCGSQEIEQLCISKSTCGDCIETSIKCSWCSDELFSNPRCNFENNLKQSGCRSIFTSDKETTHEILMDNAFQNVKNGDPREAVQIQPQKIKISLRPKQPYTVQMKYRAAKNYPLNLYYLMDLTWSMRHDISTMVSLGEDLAKQLRSYTDFYRLGFGYFSDKIAMPFAQLSEPFLKNPCSMHTGLDECKLGFDFKHNLNFTADIVEFIKSVNSSSITSTVDNLEGGMDALYQILVCGENMKWQKDSRKLVVLATDGLAHFGGDGKLSGTVKKPQYCHLDKDGIYTQSLVEDYPSLEEIYRKLVEKKTNVVFAAKSSVYKYYEKMNQIIPEVTYLTKLEDDSKNLLDLISKGYKNFISVIDFQANVDPPLKVHFKSSCNKPEFEYNWNETTGCSNVVEEEEFTFNVTFVLESCPQDSEKQGQTVVIEERNIFSENLTIDVEYICGCQHCSSQEQKSGDCNNRGKKECGVCKCDDGWSGSNCSCDLSRKETENLDDHCRNKNANSTNNYICSLNGNCLCGVCNCEELYYGKYCECKHCPKYNNEACGGPFRGKCHCGVCTCEEGYKGEKCECSMSPDKCIRPGTKQICSGKGVCECETCGCKSITVRNLTLAFTGQYCENCFNCEAVCKDYENCVLDFVQNGTKSCEDFMNVSRSQSNNMPQGAEMMYFSNCFLIYEKLKTSEKCTVKYLHDLKSEILILSEECEALPLPAVFKISTGIIIGVLLIGLLLLMLYKLKTYVQDKRDWVAYQKSLNSTLYDTGENPLYLSPITMHEVPRNMKD